MRLLYVTILLLLLIAYGAFSLYATTPAHVQQIQPLPTMFQYVKEALIASFIVAHSSILFTCEIRSTTMVMCKFPINLV